MKTIAIHQPEFLPWLGFCDKALSADVLVLLDTVQFRRNYFQNRNRLRTADGWHWMTIPVRHPQLIAIRELAIDLHSPLLRKNSKRLEQAYGGAPFFDDLFPKVAEVLDAGHERLVELNIALIRLLFDSLKIRTEIVRASDLGPRAGVDRTDLLCGICRQLDASAYLSGISGREYLELERFEAAGISVVFQEFRHPVYRQLFEPFVPCMSTIDLLLNHGPRSRDILSGSGVDRLSTVFT